MSIIPKSESKRAAVVIKSWVAVCHQAPLRPLLALRVRRRCACSRRLCSTSRPVSEGKFLLVGIYRDGSPFYGYSKRRCSGEALSMLSGGVERSVLSVIEDDCFSVWNLLLDLEVFHVC